MRFELLFENTLDIYQFSLDYISRQLQLCRRVQSSTVVEEHFSYENYYYNYIAVWTAERQITLLFTQTNANRRTVVTIGTNWVCFAQQRCFFALSS